jgi:ABC-type glycerol-3-phosphate transport system substrate-binding protein
MEDALSTYLSLVQKYGPPGVTANGFNENLTLFASGKAAMWIDATVAGVFWKIQNSPRLWARWAMRPPRSP